MKLFTGYFARHGKHPNAVSVGGSPWWMKLPVIPELAPSAELLADYKQGRIQWEDYVPRYIAQLDALGVSRVESLLKDGMVLLCWEKPPNHCHRHLLAEWLRKQGHYVSELIE